MWLNWVLWINTGQSFMFTWHVNTMHIRWLDYLPHYIRCTFIQLLVFFSVPFLPYYLLALVQSRTASLMPLSLNSHIAQGSTPLFQYFSLHGTESQDSARSRAFPAASTGLCTKQTIYAWQWSLSSKEEYKQGMKGFKKVNKMPWVCCKLKVEI